MTAARQKNIDIQVIRSGRRTLSLEIRKDGSVLVRAPRCTSQAEIRNFVERHAKWLSGHLAEAEDHLLRKKQLPVLSPEQKKICMENARKKFTERTDYFAVSMGVSYGRISIRDQKTRWGSCSSRGNLNFCWRLILAPESVLDYVVVHELCHRKFMDHSPAFWAEVAAVLPDYEARRAWLNENGWMLDVQEKEAGTRSGRNGEDKNE